VAKQIFFVFIIHFFVELFLYVYYNYFNILERRSGIMSFLNESLRNVIIIMFFVYLLLLCFVEWVKYDGTQSKIKLLFYILGKGYCFLLPVLSVCAVMSTMYITNKEKLVIIPVFGIFMLSDAFSYAIFDENTKRRTKIFLHLFYAFAGSFFSILFAIGSENDAIEEEFKKMQWAYISEEKFAINDFSVAGWDINQEVKFFCSNENEENYDFAVNMDKKTECFYSYERKCYLVINRNEDVEFILSDNDYISVKKYEKIFNYNGRSKTISYETYVLHLSEDSEILQELVSDYESDGNELVFFNKP